MLWRYWQAAVPPPSCLPAAMPRSRTGSASGTWAANCRLACGRAPCRSHGGSPSSFRVDRTAYDALLLQAAVRVGAHPLPIGLRPHRMSVARSIDRYSPAGQRAWLASPGLPGDGEGGWRHARLGRPPSNRWRTAQAISGARRTMPHHAIGLRQQCIEWPYIGTGAGRR
jgi:hypothetical protein